MASTSAAGSNSRRYCGRRPLKGRLVLIIDSDLDEITSIATKIIVLRDGRTVLVANEEQADKRRLLEACYGGGGQDL